MSMISEQAKELREISKNFSEWEYNRFYDTISIAADTIEALSAKQQTASMERSVEDCGGGWIPCSVDHMPHRGSAVLIRLRNVYDDFNPHSHEGSDVDYPSGTRRTLISIHTPTKGVTILT